MKDYLGLWKKYERLQVFHLVAAKYYKALLLPTIFTLSASITITVYVCLRDNGLPWWLFGFFLYLSFSLLMCTFWFSFQLVMVVRASEDVVGVHPLRKNASGI